MALEQTIADVVEKLREGAFPNEQSVSQGIVLRVLSGLHWDVFEPKVVWPEYATAGGGRADFALCEPRSKPKVLIEVKQPGKAAGGIKQSLEYAFHTGVPFVVLTDGRTWSFYLPAEPGDYEDRRVFKLDLYEYSAQRSAAVLENYLHWQVVASGKALEDARSEHRSKARRTLARQAIPDAWRRLVEQSDELLIELVGDAVESREGVRPSDSEVAAYLKSLALPLIPSHRPSPGVATADKPVGHEAAESVRNHTDSQLKAQGVRVIQRQTIGGEICFWLREGFDTEQILSKVRQKHPHSNTTKGSVANYRSNLKTGKIVLEDSV